jgi:predicted ATPase/DNA-binding CsgD family transcriptional regulator
MSFRERLNDPGMWPSQRTPLIGREREVAAARALLLEEAAPLLTIVGPGGVGKTRLAIAVAQEVETAFEAGAAFVELAPVRDPELLPSTVATALGISTTRRKVMDAIIPHLRARQCLLLLDNCEHLIQSAATLAAMLLSACPALQILATSRAPLHVRGEHLLQAMPLAIPDPGVIRLEEVRRTPAVRLFAHAARAARSDFTLDEQNAAVVAAICRELDGLPLAIELASARSGLLSPSAMLALMSQRLRLLTRGPRDASPRHQTLRDTIAWSHDLLQEPERIVMRRLAVFAGGFTLPAAGAVATAGAHPDIDLLDALAPLVDQSLLVRHEDLGGEARFRMLETIREFAQERLGESGEEAAIRAAHAAFFLDIAEDAEPRLRGADQSLWLTRLEADHANLRAALHWFVDRGNLERALRLAGALELFWRRHGHFTEGRQWLEGLLAEGAGGDARPVPPAVRARGAHAAGTLAWSQGDFTRARSHLEVSRELFDAAGDERAVAYTLYNLASQVKLQGDFARAADLYREGLARYEAMADDWGIATLRHATASLALDSGDFECAERQLTGTVELARSVGDRWLLGAVLSNLGMALARQGELERAEPLLAEALALFHAIGERRWIAHTRSFQGLLATWRGDHDAALAAFREALGLAVELDVRFYIAEILERMAALIIASGAAEPAARLLGAAGALRECLAAPPLPIDRVTRDQALDAARSMLGDATIAASFAAGRTLPLHEAVAEALAFEVVTAADPGIGAIVRPLPTLADALRLTTRERQVLALLCQRMTDQEIGERLYISRRTAAHHVGSILAKLGATNRRQAAALAARQNLF